ncbi:MAG: cupredoxin domain-containing protein [Actinomycetota bacterium]
MWCPTKRAPTLILVLTFLASACGGSDTALHAHGTPLFGVAGDPSQADRTITIDARDPYQFEPDEVSVDLGETVTFVVTNEGGQDHEFVLGDEDFQESHGSSRGAMTHDEPYAMSLEPGDTKEITWRFTDAGEGLFGCHIADHYEGGMVGTISVSG